MRRSWSCPARPLQRRARQRSWTTSTPGSRRCTTTCWPKSLCSCALGAAWRCRSCGPARAEGWRWGRWQVRRRQAAHLSKHSPLLACPCRQPQKHFSLPPLHSAGGGGAGRSGPSGAGPAAIGCRGAGLCRSLHSTTAPGLAWRGRPAAGQQGDSGRRQRQQQRCNPLGARVPPARAGAAAGDTALLPGGSHAGGWWVVSGGW